MALRLGLGTPAFWLRAQREVNHGKPHGNLIKPLAMAQTREYK